MPPKTEMNSLDLPIAQFVDQQQADINQSLPFLDELYKDQNRGLHPTISSRPSRLWRG